MKKAVLDANRKFYDAIAENYEKIDGRRNSELESWLRKNLYNISKRCSAGKLLDLGTGSGLVSRCVRGLFNLRIAIDVSQKIIALNRNSFNFGLVADINNLPFASESFDAIVCFSVLHHLYDFELLVSEVSRVLKPGGIFYSDHDLEKTFSERFHMLLTLYRKFCNSKARYINSNTGITSELYKLTEYHEKGIDSEYLADLFMNKGFSVECCFHWFGLTPITDLVFKKRWYAHGYAPLFSMIAIKTK